MLNVMPYLIAADAASAIAFYTAAFDATEFVRLTMPDGKIAHAEIRIGKSRFMLADAFPDMGYRSPADLGGSPVSVLIYVADADATFARAVELGATSVSDPSDQFDGDRRGTLTDPSGHTWLVATKREELDASELNQRFSAMMAQNGG